MRVLAEQILKVKFGLALKAQAREVDQETLMLVANLSMLCHH
jgi:hypothetical protein